MEAVFKDLNSTLYGNPRILPITFLYELSSTCLILYFFTLHKFLADTLILWKTIDSQSTCSLATEDIVGKARQQVNIFFCTIFIASVVIIISALVHNALEMYIDVCCIDII